MNNLHQLIQETLHNADKIIIATHIRPDGDALGSLLGLGLATGATFKHSAIVANAAAGIVVAKVGTATASIEELTQVLTDSI